jgi:hypothetical protein
MSVLVMAVVVVDIYDGSLTAGMPVLVKAAVVVDIYDGSLTAGMSALVMMAEAVDTHGGSVDTVDNRGYPPHVRRTPQYQLRNWDIR